MSKKRLETIQNDLCKSDVVSESKLEEFRKLWLRLAEEKENWMYLLDAFCAFGDSWPAGPQPDRHLIVRFFDAEGIQPKIREMLRDETILRELKARDSSRP